MQVGRGSDEENMMRYFQEVAQFIVKKEINSFSRVLSFFLGGGECIFGESME